MRTSELGSAKTGGGTAASREARDEVRAWYRGRLRPRVLAAARRGAVPARNVVELERLLDDLLRDSASRASKRG